MTRLRAVAGVLGALGVAAGAFGAHGLSSQVPAPDLDVHLELWRTAAHYHLIHAVALLGLALANLRDHAARLAAGAFVAGILVFSGTLYGIVLGGPRWLGAVTPLGGAALIVGWIALAWSGFRRVAVPAADA